MTRSGPLLLTALERTRMSQREVADALKCSRSYVAMVLSGQETVSLKQIERWCRVLQVSAEERDEIKLACALDHTPDVIVDLVERLKAQVANTQRL